VEVPDPNYPVPMGEVAVGAILFALLLVVVAALVWQEARRDPKTDPPLYLLDEAARFVLDGLSESAAGSLGLMDVRRILDWGIYYNQVVAFRDEGRRVVVGSGDAIEFVMERAAAIGKEYDPLHIAEVMAGETEYLVEIGAIGAPLEEEVG
jgi:hypothetical protein